MKRIVFTVTTDLTYDQRMSRICSTLDESGFDVLIVGRRKKNSLPLKEKRYKQHRLNCIFEKGAAFYAEYNIRLFFYLMFCKADIISGADIDSALPGVIVSKLRGKPFVFDAHEYFTEVVELQNRPKVKQIWSRIEAFILRRTRYAYTVSEGLKKMFQEKYGKVFEVIRNVPLFRQYDEIEKKEKYIIYAGAVNAGRGLEELIDVWSEINEKLYICGDGDMLDELKSRVWNAGLNERVIFTGYLQPEELRNMIGRAYVGVLLLRGESLSYYYSLANKFFDYMHAGIPQLTIDFPEYKTINEQYEVALLCPLQKEEIKSRLNKLLTDQLLYLKLKENALKASHHFNWQKESEKLLNIYKRAAEE